MENSENTNTQVPVIIFDFENSLNLPIEDIRNMIGELEVILKTAPQIEVPLKHYFSPGVYGREVKIAKDTLLIGKIHKSNTMNVLSSGEVSVLSIDGVMRFKAPHTFVSSPGAKRVIYAHEDSTWTTFHGTEETDVAKIEDQFIAKSYDDICIEDSKEVIELLPESSLEENKVCLG